MKLKAKKRDVLDCAIVLFKLRDFLGNVKEILYAILTWPILYLVNAEYTKLKKAAHKTDHYPTFQHHVGHRKAGVHHMNRRSQHARTSERLPFPESNRY